MKDLKAVHEVELKMLKAVADLCDKYGIRYVLYCGTLLGAVRHGGFIPWDDDIDIAMPMKDYFRFLQVADELPERYECANLGNTRDFYLLWTKISAKGTTSMPTACAALQIPWGIYLDVYPLIGAAETERGLKRQRWMLDAARRLRSVGCYRVLGKPGIGKKILGIVPFFIRKSLSDLLLRIAMRDPADSEHVGTLDAAVFDGKFEWADWQDFTRLKFEDSDFPVPEKFDKMLRIMYGDYMKLPPEENRVPHIDAHGEVIIDAERDYHLYQKELAEA